MSIFVDQDEVFPITIHYKTLKDDDGHIVGVKILNSNDEDATLLVCNVRGCDFVTMSKIMEQSTIINHYTGKPVLRSAVFFRLMILNFFVSWNAADKDGFVRPINDETVGAIHDKVARALVSKYLKTIGGK